MGIGLINSLNYFHDFPDILVFTTDFDELNKIGLSSNVKLVSFENTRYNYGNWHPLIWAKLECFRLDSDVVIFLDSDIIMYKDIHNYINQFLSNKSIFAATPDDEELHEQFHIKIDFLSNKKRKAFNAGFFMTKPKIGVYDKLINLAEKYHEYSIYPEQGILNLFFHSSSWEIFDNNLIIFPWCIRLSETPRLYSMLHFYAPRPQFFGSTGVRPTENSVEFEVLRFKNNYNIEYPIDRIETEFKIREYNQLWSEGILQKLSEYYSIRSTLKISKIKRSFENSIRWVLSSEDEKYFLKQKHESANLDNFKIGALANKLAGNNSYSPSINSNNQGDPVMEFNQRYFVLIDWIPDSEEFQIHPNDIESLVNTITAIIRSNDSISISCNKEFSSQKNKWSLKNPLDYVQYLSYLERLVKGEETSLNDEVTFIKEWLLKVDKIFKKNIYSEKIIHGDLYGDNIIENSKGKLFVIDFDDTYFGYLMSEIATSICFYSGFEKQEDRYTIKKFDWNLSNRLFSNFLKNIALSKIDQTSLNLFLGLSYIRLLIDLNDLDEAIVLPEEVKFCIFKLTGFLKEIKMFN